MKKNTRTKSVSISLVNVIFIISLIIIFCVVFFRKQVENFIVGGNGLKNSYTDITVSTLVKDSKSTTDTDKNTQVLQKAIDDVAAAGGGTVTLPAGQYYFTIPDADKEKHQRDRNDGTKSEAFIIYLKSGVNIKGAGQGSTILSPVGSYDSVYGISMFYFGLLLDKDYNGDHSGSLYLQNATYSDFTIDGSNVDVGTHYNGSGRGMGVVGAKNCTFSNIVFDKMWSSGLDIYFPYDTTVSSCLAIECGRGGKTKSDITKISGSNGFHFQIGHDTSENISVKNCISSNNCCYGFLIENGVRTNGDTSLYKATYSSKGFNFNSCEADVNGLYDFATLRGNDVTFNGCKSKSTDVVKIFHIADYSRRITITNSNISTNFTDVNSANLKYYDAVKWALNNGITNGIKAQTFGPSETMKRKYVILALYRMYNNNQKNIIVSKTIDDTANTAIKDSSGSTLSTSFTDLTTGAVWYDAVYWAQRSDVGITAGFSDTEFGPDKPVTFYQFAQFLYLYDYYTQNAQKGTQLKDPINDFIIKNNINYNTDLTANSKSSTELTRAQVYQMLYNYGVTSKAKVGTAIALYKLTYDGGITGAKDVPADQTVIVEPTKNAEFTLSTTTPSVDTQTSTSALHFYVNGGDSTGASGDVEQITVTTDNKFSNWLCDNDKKTYKPGDKVTVGTNNYITTMTAQWDKNVSYSSITLPKATKNGDEFIAWYDSNGNKVGKAGETYTPKSDDVINSGLYAHWKSLGTSTPVINKLPGNIKLTPSTTSFTNKPVTVKAETTDQNVKLVISVDGGVTYKEYTDDTVTLNKNAKVYAMETDGTNYSDAVPLDVTWIDTNPPTTTKPTATSVTSSSITIQSNQVDNESGLSGKVQYNIYDSNGNELSSTDESTTDTWQNGSTFTNLNSNTKYILKTKASDKAGNESTSEPLEVTTSVSSSSSITDKPSLIQTTKNSTVYVVATENSNYILQMKINDDSWHDAILPDGSSANSMIVTNDGDVVYARYRDKNDENITGPEASIVVHISSEDTGKDTGKDTGTDTGKDTGKDTGTDTGKDTGKDTGTDTGKDTGKDTGTDTGKDTGKDTGTDTGKDTGTDTGKDTGTDTGKDTGKDTGTDTGKDTGTDTGKDTGTDTGTDTGKDTGTDTGKDTGTDTGSGNTSGGGSGSTSGGGSGSTSGGGSGSTSGGSSSSGYGSGSSYSSGTGGSSTSKSSTGTGSSSTSTSKIPYTGVKRFAITLIILACIGGGIFIYKYKKLDI